MLQQTSIAIVKHFNRDTVQRFHNLFEEVMEKHNFAPVMVFNTADMRTSSNMSHKMLLTYGKKQIGVVSRKNTYLGVLAIAICYCSDSGWICTARNGFNCLFRKRDLAKRKRLFMSHKNLSHLFTVENFRHHF